MLPIQESDTRVLQNFQQEIVRSICAARACPQVCRVLGYCYKEQQLCLVMLRYASSLVGLVSGDTHKVTHVVLMLPLHMHLSAVHDT